MIAIKDMPMPKNCYECWFEDANRCYLNIIPHIESLDRPEWCPLVEIIEPIKHGRWEQDRKAVACSECDYHYISVDLPLHKYCPNCGAKMDEVTP